MISIDPKFAPNYGFDVLSEAFQKPAPGPSTYLHAVPGKGWPYDHKAEDAFELPAYTAALVDHAQKAKPYIIHELNETPEYKAEFGTDGSARLYLYQPRKLVGTFDTFADAQLAAEALNNHKGY